MTQFSSRIEDIHRKLTRKQTPLLQRQQIKTATSLLSSFQSESCEQGKMNESLLSSFQRKLKRLSQMTCDSLHAFTQEKHSTIEQIISDAVQGYNVEHSETRKHMSMNNALFQREMTKTDHQHQLTIHNHKAKIKDLVQILKREMNALKHMCQLEDEEENILFKKRSQSAKEHQINLHAVYEKRSTALKNKIEEHNKNVLIDVKNMDKKITQKSKKSMEVLERVLQIY